MIDLLLFILWAYSPYIILRPIIFIFELFDHESYECIEDWKVCNCLKCRIERKRRKNEEFDDYKEDVRDNYRQLTYEELL